MYAYFSALLEACVGNIAFVTQLPHEDCVQERMCNASTEIRDKLKSRHTIEHCASLSRRTDVLQQ